MSVEVYWLARYETGVPPGDEWLSGREVEALGRLRIPKRRAEWRLGRWAAKSAVAARIGWTPHPEALAALEVRPAPSGVPLVFIRGSPAEWIVSISHSHGTGFCAVAAAGGGLGCDVERVAPHSRSFITDYFTAEEQDLVAGSPADERMKLLTLLWSAKESVLKALQCGLRHDTRTISARPFATFSGNREEWRRLAADEAGGRTFQGWWRQTGDLIWTLVAVPDPAVPIAL